MFIFFCTVCHVTCACCLTLVGANRLLQQQGHSGVDRRQEQGCYRHVGELLSLLVRRNDITSDLPGIALSALFSRNKE